MRRSAGSVACIALWFALVGTVAAAPGARAATCTLGQSALKPELECLSVPVGGNVRIAAVRAPASGSVTGLPVLMLAGGPGVRSIEAIQSLLATPLMAQLRRHHEIIALDPRNTGGSRPVAGCPAIDANLGPDPLDATQLSDCMLVNTEAFGNDERSARVEDDVRDAALVRTALGIPRWDVVASSWDARTAVRLAAFDRDATRALVLVAPAAVNGPVYDTRYAEQRILVLDRITADCAQQLECQTRFPALAHVLARVFARLDQTPVALTLRSATGRLVSFDASATALAEGLLGQASGARASDVPLLAASIGARLDNGLDIPAPAAGALFGVNEPPLGRVNAFTFLVQVCRAQEGAEPVDVVQRRYGSRAGLWLASKYVAACSVLHLPPLPPLPDATLPDGLPALVLFGRYDAQVPESAARALVQGHLAAHLVMFTALGHEIGLDTCAATVASAFLDSPDTPVDTRCSERQLTFRTDLAPQN